MSIKPIEMQVTITTKVPEVAKQKQDEQAKEGAILQQQEKNIAQEAQRKSKKVNANENAEGKVVAKEKDDTKGSNDKKNKKKKSKPNKFEEKHIIDYKI